MQLELKLTNCWSMARTESSLLSHNSFGLALVLRTEKFKKQIVIGFEKTTWVAVQFLHALNFL